MKHFYDGAQQRAMAWRPTGTNPAAPLAARPLPLPTTARGTTMGAAALPALAALPAAIGSVVSPQVAKASVRAVAELLSCCLLGVLAAKRGVLSPVNVAALSKVCV